jgi:hypothetical protein
MFCLVVSCSPTTQPLDAPEAARQKITFDLTIIDEQGLTGPIDGKVLIAYIFRIPFDNFKRKEVASIDPSIRFFKKPGEGEYTCIGEGANPAALIRLGQLPYIRRIDRFYGE